MFKYFKRSGRTSSERSPQPAKNESKRHSLCLSTSSCDESINFDEIYDTNEEENVFEYSSRLSMNLRAIVNEKNCLIYFVQFLEAKKALPLIKFYLDTQNFKVACEISPKSKSPDVPTTGECCSCVAVSDEMLNSDAISLQSQQSVPDDNSQKEGNECVPGSKALYDLSMRKSLTDDEKSQIYAEKNKRHLERSESTSSNSYHTCKTTDAICIYKKYFMPSAEQYVPLPVSILSEISLALCSDGQSCHSQKISTNLFENAQQYVLDKLEHEYLYDFLQSDLYCKYCIELLSSSEMTLIDIIYSESALFYFMEYLEQENQRNYLDFWMAAINFRRHYESKPISDFNLNEAQSDAMILYEKYFSLQAEYPLRISDRIRSIVEECICSNEATSKISRCFDRPLKIIETYLEKEFFQSFIESQLYSKYLNELQSKLSDHKQRPDTSAQQQVHQKVTKHRKTMSDCTNKNTKDLRKHFISQHNTLLAMESHSGHTQKSSAAASTNKNSPDMHIDSRHFVNPDMLWQRYQPNGLKFGRINSLGRYERDFDTCPVSKNWSLGSSTIKSVVRKLVNIPEDKIQEEIAWQIAEMIIDDVMSITMKNRKLSRKSV